MFELLAGDLHPTQLGLILAAAFASGFFHTFSGFAGGVLLSVAIAPILGVAAVVPVLAVALVISASSRIWVFRGDVDLRIFATVMVPALPGIVVGALIYARLDASAISLLLGLVLLSTTLLRRWLQRKRVHVGTVLLGCAGVLFGTISGMTIGGGLLLVPFVLGAGLRRERLAALFAAIGFCLNMTKSLVFAATMTLDGHLMALGIATGLCTIPGTYAGYWLLKTTRVSLHTMLVEGFVLAAAIGFLVHGLA